MKTLASDQTPHHILLQPGRSTHQYILFVIVGIVFITITIVIVIIRMMMTMTVMTLIRVKIGIREQIIITAPWRQRTLVSAFRGALGYHGKGTGRQRETTGDNGRQRATTGDNGRQRETTGDNGRQRATTGDNGRQRETTGDNGRQRATTGGPPKTKVIMHPLAIETDNRTLQTSCLGNDDTIKYY